MTDPQRLPLIDDETTVRGTITALLRASGHTGTEADGGAAGLALLAEMPVDVVMTDLGMPDVTGWDVAKVVTVRSPRLPVIRGIRPPWRPCIRTGWWSHRGEPVPPGGAPPRPGGGVYGRVG